MLSKARHLENFSKMTEYYPGLKKYRIEAIKEEDVDKDIEKGKIEIMRRETSCLTFFILILMLSLTVAVVRYRRDVPESFWLQSGIHAHLLAEYEQS
jgi:hypothetical protein